MHFLDREHVSVMDMKQKIIKIGNAKIGIHGLEEAIQEVKKQNIQSDDQIMDILFSRLLRHNYIAPSAAEEYKKAFLQEYNREIGRTVSEEPGMNEIKVLGPGCFQCDRLAEKVLKYLAEMNLTVDLEYIKDISEFSNYGVYATPALIINGKLMVSGRLPTDCLLKTWLKDLQERKNV